MNSRSTKTALSVLLTMTLAAGMPVWAHHSGAMFDSSKEVVLEGKVKEFQWTNPHIWIQLLVDQGGKQVEYAIEGAGPNGLVRQGWSRGTFKPGDHVKVKVFPLKDGGPGGMFVSATLADGKVVGDRKPAGERPGY